jgi:pimeloyl-ACP methyl ester carboxylesterase
MHPDFESITVGGLELRYHCSGEGSPTVVLDQGHGISVEESLARHGTIGWARIVREVSKTTRIFVHDRAGLGWSDAAPAPRASLEMVEDLHALLEKAQIPPPYVLVGHSLGGFNVRVFAGRYPNEVAGMVLIDSSHPDQWTRYAGIEPRVAPRDGQLLNRFRRHAGTLSSIGAIDVKTSTIQVRDINWLGTKPLTVVSRSPHAMPIPNPRLPAGVAEEMEKIWSELQADLLTLSGNSRQIVAHHAGHMIQVDEPQLVVDAIADVVRQVQVGVPALH